MRSPEVIRGQMMVKIEMFTQRLHFWHAFSYVILDQHKLLYFDLKSHMRSPVVAGGQKDVKIEKYTQGLDFWHAYIYDSIAQHRL